MRRVPNGGHCRARACRKHQSIDTRRGRALVAFAEAWRCDICVLLRSVSSPTGTQNGNTPLFLAAMNGHLECIELLLKHGANKDAKDKVRAQRRCTTDTVGGCMNNSVLTTVAGAERSYATADPRYAAALGCVRGTP